MEALRRYTNLAATLKLLQDKRITLLPPDTWDDVNDRRLVEAYRKKKNLGSVLCLCFAEAEETYHHWKVFAPGTDGMCLVFDKQRILEAFTTGGARPGNVQYYTANELSAAGPDLEGLPFAKRSAYKPELELRVIWTSKTENVRAKEFEFPIAAIERVIINPWLPDPLAGAVKNAIRQTPGCSGLEVLQSRVTDGPAWRRLADSFV